LMENAPPVKIILTLILKENLAFQTPVRKIKLLKKMESASNVKNIIRLMTPESNVLRLHVIL
jgi:hypothetical protein